jgi:hypothetical protein
MWSIVRTERHSALRGLCVDGHVCCNNVRGKRRWACGSPRTLSHRFLGALALQSDNFFFRTLVLRTGVTCSLWRTKVV